MQINLGFTPIKAVDLSKHLEQGEYSDHKTTLQWAQDSIESELKCNILLAGKPNYGITKPYNIAENLGDFEIPTDEEEDAVLVKAVDTFWVPLEELEPGVPWIHHYRTQDGTSLDSTKYWFHNTDHEAAINIIRKHYQ